MFFNRLHTKHVRSAAQFSLDMVRSAAQCDAMNFQVISPFNGAAIAGFQTRGGAEQFCNELNAAECHAIALYNADQREFCKTFGVPFISFSYSVHETHMNEIQ